MRFQRLDYQNRIIDRAGIIPDDEPVILFRAQDRFAPAALRSYATQLLKNGFEREAEEIFNWVDEFLLWQNTEKVKIPDFPTTAVVQTKLNL